MKRYFVGHYSPAGNHFFAFSIKDTVVDWLNPKPIAYRRQSDGLSDLGSSDSGIRDRESLAVRPIAGLGCASLSDVISWVLQ